MSSDSHPLRVPPVEGWAIRNLVCIITSTVATTREEAWNRWAGLAGDLTAGGEKGREHRMRYWKRRGFRAVRVRILEVR